MPRILIMNAGTPQMSGAHLTKAQLSLAANSAFRSAWFAQEGDLIVSPVDRPICYPSLAERSISIHRLFACLYLRAANRQSSMIVRYCPKLLSSGSKDIFARNQTGNCIPATLLKASHAWRPF